MKNLSELCITKFEIRISKSETISKLEILNPKLKSESWNFWSFDIVSSFVSFEIAQDRFRDSNLAIYLLAAHSDASSFVARLSRAPRTASF